MTNEEMERAIEFLLKNQAAYDARQAAFDARHAALDARFEAEHEQTNQQIRELSARQDRTQVQLDHLSTVVASIAEVTQRNSAGIEALVKLVGGLLKVATGRRKAEVPCVVCLNC